MRTTEWTIREQGGCSRLRWRLPSPPAPRPCCVQRRTVPRHERLFAAGIACTYRPVVTIVEDHEVIESGPYRWVRHPMYLGGMAICAGVASALSTGPTVTAWLLPPVFLVRRIIVEEHVLAESLGERYTDYARDRARLFPGCGDLA
jgi:protein-S-isoprenylcysteine O-methyltransferase Ste14